ncbi:hypothetical protein MTO96_033694 [Rhipicephalus appendiculatus]
MLSRARLSAVLIPSPLLTYPESSSERSDSDDDLNRVCEEEFDSCSTSRNEFRRPRNFRLPRVSCYALIERFSKSSFYPSNQRHGGSPAKTAEEHILSFLWYAANNSSMREVAVLFDMAESTQLLIIDRVLDFIAA